MADKKNYTGPESYRQLRKELRDKYSNATPIIPNPTYKQPADFIYDGPEQSYLYKNTGGADFWGNSWFDKGNPTEETLYGDSGGIEEVRAQNQPWYAKIGAGIGKAATTAGTTFLSGTLGLLYGAGAAINQGRWSGIWDNDLTNTLNDFNETMEKVLPNYYTQAEQNAPWYSTIFTANFLGDKLIKNLGFSIGALYSGGLFTKAIQGVGYLSKLGTLALKSGNLIKTGTAMKAIQGINSTAKALSAWGGSLYSAVGEGSIEAINNSKEWANNEKAKAYELYQDGKLTNEQYHATLAKIEEDRLNMGNLDLLMNIPLLTVGNFIQFGRMYARGKMGLRNSLNIKGKPGEYTSSVTKGSKVWAASKGFFTEGQEEINQKAAGTIAGKYYDTDVNNFIRAQMDPKAEQETLSGWKAMTEGLAETYGDINSWEEFFIGGLTGLMGIPMFRNPRVNGKWRSPIKIEGGAFNELREMSDRQADEERVADYMNKRFKDPNFRNYYQGLVRHNAYENAMEKAVGEDDDFDYHNAKNGQLTNDINMFAKGGKLADLQAMVEGALDTSDDNLKAIFENTSKQGEDGKWSGIATTPEGTPVYDTPEGKQKLIDLLNKNKKKILDKIKEVSSIRDQVLDSIPAGTKLTDDQENELVYMKSQINNFNKRKSTLAAKVKPVIKTKLKSIQDEIDEIENKLNNSIRYSILKPKGLFSKLFGKKEEERQIDVSKLGNKIANERISKEEEAKLLKRLESLKASRDNLTQLISKEDEDLGRILSTPENNGFTTSLLINQLRENKGTQTLSEEDISALKGLNDLARIGQAEKQFQEKFNEYIGNPTKQAEDHEKIKQEESAKRSEKRTESSKDRLSEAENVKDFERVYNGLQLEDDEKQETLDSLIKDGNKVAIEYKDSEDYKRAVRYKLSALGLQGQTLQDAYTLFIAHSNAAKDISELLNSNSATLLDTSFFNNNSANEAEAEQRFLNAQYNVQRAMGLVAEDSRFKSRFVKPQKPTPKPKTPVKTPTTPPINDEGPVDNGPTPPVNSNSEGPVGDISSEELGEEFKEQGKVDTGQNQKGKKLYYRPAIPEVHIEGSKKGDFRTFKEVVLEREGLHFEEIYDYLEKAGAFQFVKDGKLQAGDDLVFMIDPEFEEQIKDKKWHTEPVIFIVHQKTGTIVGSLDSGQSVSNFSGLAKLRQDIIEEYNKSQKDNTQSSETSVDDKFNYTIKGKKGRTIKHTVKVAETKTDKSGTKTITFKEELDDSEKGHRTLDNGRGAIKLSFADIDVEKYAENDMTVEEAEEQIHDLLYNPLSGKEMDIFASKIVIAPDGRVFADIRLSGGSTRLPLKSDLGLRDVSSSIDIEKEEQKIKNANSADYVSITEAEDSLTSKVAGWNISKQGELYYVVPNSDKNAQKGYKIIKFKVQPSQAFMDAFHDNIKDILSTNNNTGLQKEVGDLIKEDLIDQLYEKEKESQKIQRAAEKAAERKVQYIEVNNDNFFTSEHEKNVYSDVKVNKEENRNEPSKLGDVLYIHDTSGIQSAIAPFDGLDFRKTSLDINLEDLRKAPEDAITHYTYTDPEHNNHELSYFIVKKGGNQFSLKIWRKLTEEELRRVQRLLEDNIKIPSYTNESARIAVFSKIGYGIIDILHTKEEVKSHKVTLTPTMTEVMQDERNTNAFLEKVKSSFKKEIGEIRYYKNKDINTAEDKIFELLQKLPIGVTYDIEKGLILDNALVVTTSNINNPLNVENPIKVGNKVIIAFEDDPEQFDAVVTKVDGKGNIIEAIDDDGIALINNGKILSVDEIAKIHLSISNLEQQKSKPTQTKNKPFTSSKITKVSKIMIGKLAYTQEEKSLNNIPNVRKQESSGRVPQFAIVKNGVLVTADNISQNDIVPLVDISNKEGRLYLLVPNGAGKYSPAAVRVKHFNTEEFNLNDDTVANTAIGKKISEAIKGLSKVENNDDLKDAIAELSKVLYIGNNIHIDYISSNGGGIRIAKAEVDVNGNEIYETNEKGEKVRKETKRVVYFTENSSVKGEFDDNGNFIPASSGTKTTSEKIKEITDALLYFNLPIQVSISDLGNRKVFDDLISSNVLTSNLKNAETVGDWFVTDYFDDNGNRQKAIPPASKAPISPSNNPVVKGTALTINGEVIHVDVDSGMIYDKNGSRRATSADQLLIDLALAQNYYGDKTEGISMINNCVVLKSGKVLDRTRQKYLEGEEADKIKKALYDRNNGGKKKGESIVAQIKEDQKKVDRSRTDSESYYILEEDGEYHAYDRVHKRIGSNWNESVEQKQIREEVENNLTKVLNDKKRFNDGLDYYSKKFNIDLSSLKDKNTKESISTVISLINDSIIKNRSSRALEAGNSVDEIGRQVFMLDDLSKISKPDNLSQEAFNTLITSFSNIKAQLLKQGYQIFTDRLVLYKKYPDGSRVAGEVDMLLMDKDGNFYIYDFKTSAYPFGNFVYKGRTVNFFEEQGPNQNKSTKEQYTLQLSIYKNLFESKYDAKVKKLAILPFTLEYDAIDKNKVNKITVNSTIELTYNPSVNMLLVAPKVADNGPKGSNLNTPKVETDNLPIFDALNEGLNPESNLSDVVKFNTSGSKEGYYVLNNKVYKGDLLYIGSIAGLPIHLVKLPVTSQGKTFKESVNYAAIFSNGKTVIMARNAATAIEGEQIGVQAIMAALSKNPEKVKVYSNERTLLQSENRLTNNTNNNSLETSNTSQEVVQAEQAIKAKVGKNRSRPRLREASSVNESNRSNTLEEELKVLEEILPQLSREERIEIIDDYIKVMGEDALAWGKVENGIMTLSKMAEKGTVYHEAFHIVFNYSLDSAERAMLLSEVKKKNGSLSDIDLEEIMAEEFRKFQMNIISEREVATTWGQKILKFFRKLLNKIKMYSKIGTSRYALYQAISNGAYANKKLNVSDPTLVRNQREEYSDEMKEILKNAPRDAEGKLLAPNGKRSNLNERQWVQVRTKAFKEWFGDWEQVAYDKQTLEDIPNLKKRDPKKIKNALLNNLEKNLLGIEFLGRESFKALTELFDISDLDIYTGTLEDVKGLSFYSGAIVISDKLSLKEAALTLTHEIIHNFTTYAYDTNEEFKKEIDDLHKVALKHNDKFNKDVYEFMANLLHPYHINSLLEIPSPYSEKSNLLKDIIRLLTRYVRRYTNNYKNRSNRTLFHDIIESIYRNQRSNNDFANTVSKVVDENGEPLVVYHGGHSGINIFKPGGSNTSAGYYVDPKTGEHIDKDSVRTMFFSSEKNVADSYAALAINNYYNRLYTLTQSMIGAHYEGKVRISMQDFPTRQSVYEYLEEVGKINPKFLRYKEYLEDLESKKEKVPSKYVDSIRHLFIDLRRSLRDKVQNNPIYVIQHINELRKGANFISRYNNEEGIRNLKNRKIPSIIEKYWDIYKKIEKQRADLNLPKIANYEEYFFRLSSTHFIIYDGKELKLSGSGNENRAISSISKEEIHKFLDDAKKSNTFDTREYYKNYVDIDTKVNNGSYAVFLNIKNPLIYDYEGTMQAGGFKQNKKIPFEYVAARHVNKGINNGNDGVIYQNIIDPYLADNYGVFKSNQIKSATDNNGDFSTTNDDIRYRKVDDDLIDAKESKNKELLEDLRSFFNNFGITLRDVSKFDSEEPLFNALSRVINYKSIEDLTDNAGYALTFMMQYSPKIRELINLKVLDTPVALKGLRRGLRKKGEYKISKLTDSEYKYLDKTPYLKEIGKDIAEQLRTLYLGEPINTSDSYLKKIWQTITEFFNQLTPSARTMFNITKNYTKSIANAIKLGDYTIVRSSDNKSGTTEKAELVDIGEALKDNPYEESIISLMNNNGIALAGGASIAAQGSLYRPSENPLHDLDFKATNHSKEQIEDILSKNFKSYSLTTTIQDRDQTTLTYLVLDREFEERRETSGIPIYTIYDKNTGEVLGTRMNSELVITKDGVKGKMLDFFIGKNEETFTDDITVSYNGKSYLFSDYRNAMQFKIKVAREKDLWDYNRFIPRDNKGNLKSLLKLKNESKQRAKELLTKARVIWGHPAIGKTTYLENNQDIIEWDQEVNPKRDKFIRNQIDPNHEMDTSSKEYKQLRSKYMAEWQQHQEYIDFLIKEWQKLKDRAAKENKRLFASPLPLLSLFADDFDLVVALPEKQFKERDMQRGNSEYGSIGWKQNIDQILATRVNPSKLVYTTKYFSEFMRDNLGVQWGTLTREEIQSLQAKGWTKEEFDKQTQAVKDSIVECL